MKNFLRILFCVLAFVPCLSFAGGFSVEITSMTTASVTTSSALVVAANPYRNYLMIQNLGSASVIVKFGSVQSGSEGIEIPAGGNYEPFKGIIDSIYAKSASGTQTITVLQGK